MTQIVDVLIPVLWIVFWIAWFAAALHTKATRSRSRSAVGVRVLVVLVALALLRSGVLHGHRAEIGNAWLEGFGLALFLAGLGLAVWARVYLGTNWGTPMSERVDPELVTSGPYRSVRHPIYSGLIMAMIGTAMAVTLYFLVALAVLGPYFVYSATVEERTMARLFPDTYPAYRQRTRMLIPFIF